LRSIFDLAEKKKKQKKLNKEIQDINFWKDKERAIKISKEFNKINQEIKDFDNLRLQIETAETQEEIVKIEKKLKAKEKEVLFSGEYDKNGALLSIYAGVGGRDAQDWATMLLRMYLKYCERKSFKMNVLHQSFGEAGGPEGRIGIKSVTTEIDGNFAYGILKRENGVHRLVRTSPFSAKDLRHTSFAFVEVIPKIKDPTKENIDIKTDDLKIDFFRSSGPGGQYVNKKETAVRIRHLPTKIVVCCQSERFQASNRKKAMESLYSRIGDFYRKGHQKKMAKVKGDKVSVSWGNQIRNYVIYPYKLVKDLRTGVETSKVAEVLDGQLDEFIEAEIKL
jgi:peptide chain release factor 2